MYTGKAGMLRVVHAPPRAACCPSTKPSTRGSAANRAAALPALKSDRLASNSQADTSYGLNTETRQRAPRTPIQAANVSQHGGRIASEKASLALARAFHPEAVSLDTAVSLSPRSIVSVLRVISSSPSVLPPSQGSLHDDLIAILLPVISSSIPTLRLNESVLTLQAICSLPPSTNTSPQVGQLLAHIAHHSSTPLHSGTNVSPPFMTWSDAMLAALLQMLSITPQHMHATDYDIIASKAWHALSKRAPFQNPRRLVSVLTATGTSPSLCPTSARVLRQWLQALIDTDKDCVLEPGAACMLLKSLGDLSVRQPDAWRSAMRTREFDIFAFKNKLSDLVVADLQHSDPTQPVTIHQLASAISGAAALKIRSREALRVLTFATSEQTSTLPAEQAAQLMVLMFGGAQASVWRPPARFSAKLIDIVTTTQEPCSPSRTLNLLHACSRRKPPFSKEVMSRILAAADWEQQASGTQQGWLCRDAKSCMRNMATVAALGLHPEATRPFTQAVHRNLGTVLDGADVIQIVGMLRSCVSGRFKSPQLVKALMQRAVDLGSQGNNVSYAVFAAAKLNSTSHIPTLVQNLSENSNTLKLLDIQCILWGCAKSHQVPPTLTLILQRLEDLIETNREEMYRSNSAQSVTSSETGRTWGKGRKLGKASKRDLKALEGSRKAGGSKPDMPGWLMAQIAWSIAELDLREYAQSIVVYMVDNAPYGQCSPIDITNLLWAAATFSKPQTPSLLTHCNHMRYNEVCARLESSLLEWQPKELCTILWSLGRLAYNPSAVAIDSLIDQTLKGRKGLPMQHLTNAMYGISQLRHVPLKHHLEAVELHSVGVIHQMSPMDLGSLLSAFTRLGYQPTQLLDALQGLPDVRNTLRYNPECCVQVMWSMATFGASHKPLYCAAVAQVAHLSDTNLSTVQLYQVVKSHVLAVSDGVDPNILPMSIRSRARSSLKAALDSEDKCDRSVAMNIISTLRGLGWRDARMDALTRDGLFHLDIFIPSATLEGRPTVIEILGPMHVSANTGQPLGRWLLRSRLLSLYDYNVVTIDMNHWIRSSDRTNLLQELFAGVDR